MLEQLQRIIKERSLTARFQPIIEMHNGEILGYEGLIRGPSDSVLHAPINLFKVAAEHNLTVSVEHLCRRVVLEQFAAQKLPGKLFLNVSPECLLHRDVRYGETLDTIHELGINPQRVVIELTEYQPTHDYVLLCEAVRHYRQMGFQIAIDDLGEGFSSLRLWSELKPEYVKIDMHFIQGINHDTVKAQFVRSIQSIAKESGTRVIAEGIENQAELLMVRQLGVACGQGYHIARPHPTPTRAISAEVTKALTVNLPSGARRGVFEQAAAVEKILKTSITVTSAMLNNQVDDIFLKQPKLQIIPVVDQGIPIGIINRYHMIDSFARPYQRELYGKKSCKLFMDPHPVIVDKNTSMQDVSHIIVAANPEHLINGIIITDQGQYIGICSGPDLMREITHMQIMAARYANPLTQLPGNVPINEHIDQLLQKQLPFYACYCDLDHFKPFNDVYGYRRGDDIIEITSEILKQHCDAHKDFIGHIGGDDFLILFRSEDWEQRCRNILQSFAEAIQNFYSNEDRERGGYLSEDRQGQKVFYPLVCLSLGVVKSSANKFYSHHQISLAASDAKKQAKKIHGNSLFIDRRIDIDTPPLN
ncbi:MULTISPECIES: GGDEF domain-containing protein [unclassified Undibacterium]|uniref:GGDEF domain-containing protein n=1 Tax=unclassified Undibacterium TaxID=2630295 RepID=UPI002AC95CA5|nr:MULTISPECIES: GGDEF domain-containing protein [unclassified Undibacterium]MEB0140357.1 GGDEF domain-containing protein [Undibacterium sp. CCC2.1]MEB0173398.1 GGDEF domain-containing protein [Undibacterium sp. CCC1.1]MEB0176795.1 GGDEF domain-containing protein [Undibacterium sp. CCC3.4]MEB0216548.1 GGDEF domain-containing protein [Undibacterium sp. 5I2]WPX45689.1 GGDEF domain-containing protein [Undibacterium sp. CCC3.4]